MTWTWEAGDTYVIVTFSDLEPGVSYAVTIQNSTTLAYVVDTAFTATSSSATKTYRGLTMGTKYNIKVVYTVGNKTTTSSSSFETYAWSLFGTESALGTLSKEYAATHTFGKYRLWRFSMEFETSGTATFYTTGSSRHHGFFEQDHGL